MSTSSESAGSGGSSDAIVPRHVAIIMDGNNRWARGKGLPGPAGHRAGVEAVRGVLRACRQQGVEVLTLFAFSSENWGRPLPEVRTLLALLSRYLRSEVRQLHEDGVRLRFIGERSAFPEKLRKSIDQAERDTAACSGLELVVAVNYGGRWDIVDGVRRLAGAVAAGEESRRVSADRYREGVIPSSELLDAEIALLEAGLERTQARADASYHKLLTVLANTHLLAIDDWGLEPLKAAHRNDLLEIMDDRHGHTSTLVISQLPTDQWHASIGDNTLADAILDRLVHNAYKIELKGESMRKNNT